MMIKARLKKLELPDNPKEFIEEQLALNSISVIDVSMEHSFAEYDLPEIHKDPFDRMLVAQAITEQLPIITADSFIQQYEVDTIW